MHENKLKIRFSVQLKHWFSILILESPMSCMCLNVFQISRTLISPGLRTCELKYSALRKTVCRYLTVQQVAMRLSPGVRTCAGGGEEPAVLSSHWESLESLVYDSCWHTEAQSGSVRNCLQSAASICSQPPARGVEEHHHEEDWRWQWRPWGWTYEESVDDISMDFTNVRVLLTLIGNSEKAWSAMLKLSMD